MTSKAEFNAEEWSLVLAAPPIAGLRVVTADRGGTIRESLSMAQAYGDARKERGASELLDQIVADKPAMDPGEFKTPDDVKQAGMERIREAVALVDSKASTEEAEDYKRFVLDLAERVARAHKEGGFLGVGGQEVSDSERAALDEIAAVLGIDPTAS